MELFEYWLERAINAVQYGEIDKATRCLEHYKKGLLGLEPHNCFEFGRFPIFNTSYPPDHRIVVPLFWEVLERVENKILAISKNSILWEMFGSNSHGEQLTNWRITDWAHSLARERLNSSFVNSWFSDEERSLICPTTITYEQFASEHRRMATIEDYLFFLSREEIDHYYKNSDCSSQILFSDHDGKDAYRVWAEQSPYWTRSLGEPEDGITSFVIVAESGEFDETRYDSDEIGWRPAMWLDISLIDKIIQVCHD